MVERLASDCGTLTDEESKLQIFQWSQYCVLYNKYVHSTCILHMSYIYSQSLKIWVTYNISLMETGNLLRHQ